MIFKGYGSEAYTDWLYQVNTQATQKQIQFTLKEDAFDELDASGILVNCSITGNYTNYSSNAQRLNGYLLAFEYYGQPYGQKITLYKLDNVNTYQFHHGTPGDLRNWDNSKGYGTITPIGSSSVYNWNNSSTRNLYRKVKVEVMPTYIKIWLASGTGSSVFSKELGDSDLVSLTASSTITGAVTGKGYTEASIM